MGRQLMQLKENRTFPDEISSHEEKQDNTLNIEMMLLAQLGSKVQSKLYKTLLRVLVYKVEMSHLVVLIASLGLFYRGHLLVEHASLLKFSEFSVISQAHAESTPLKEKTSENQTTEPKKEDVKAPPPKDDVDPLLLDENQIKVLLALAKKGKDIKETEQEADMEKQKKIVELAQENLNRRIEELEKIKKGIESEKDELTKDEKQNVANMAKMYETMKPVQAADILNKLEMTSVTQLIKHMNPKKASAILASMEASKARLLTLEIIKSKDIDGKSTEATPAATPVSTAPPTPTPDAPAAAPAPETKAPEGAATDAPPSPTSKA
jgi:flagellar motility protein MotE (MotC chaperone)